MKKILVAFFAISTIAATFSTAMASEKTGFSIGFGVGFTSEFGGLAPTIYREEAAAEALVYETKGVAPSLALVGLGAFEPIASQASYDGDKGGSLIALIPEIFVRYDITENFFVKTGFSYGMTVYGGEWSAKNLLQSGDAVTGDYTTSTDQQPDGTPDGAVAYNVSNKYEFSTMEIPIMIGLNLPIQDMGHVYSSIGIKYTNMKITKDFAYDEVAAGGSAGGQVLAQEEALNKFNQYDVDTEYSKDFWSIQAVWAIGVDVKIAEDLYVFIEREYMTATDSFGPKNEKFNPTPGTGGNKQYDPMIISGTCDYYKVGLRYAL